jgi:HNH endonuclease
VAPSDHSKKEISSYGYPAVGRCIYCETTQGNLNKEHIIAKAIGGNVTLAKASCPTCSAITRDVEQFCFRNMLGAFRIRIGSPTRHPKDRPSQMPLTIIHTDKRVEIQSVAIPDHPAMFVMLAFLEMPHILFGRPGTDTCSIWSYIVNPAAVKKHPEGTKVGGTQFHATTFCRMLAKIAHAFAVADVGSHTFCPILPDF